VRRSSPPAGTPIIVRNLLLGCETFGEIQAGAPGIPRSLLSERLRQLEHAGIVKRSASPSRRGWRYQLTAAGTELQEVCTALGNWGARWLEVAPVHLDAAVVLWGLCRMLEQEPQRMPDGRVVIRFSLRDLPRRPFWVVLQRPEAEVCMKPPGFDEDLVVRTDSESLARWHMGRISLGHAMRARLMTIDGPRELVRQFSKWGGLGPFGNIRPPRAA
jgi:DNA-binding HxlR family transcriptional regulator